MKCAIYARVSKETCPASDCGHLKSQHTNGTGRCKGAKCKCARYQGQDPEVQLTQLRQYAKAQSWQIVEYIDFETGKHADRAQLQAMFAAAARREFGVVLVWALDRLSREGIFETLRHWRALRDNSVQFESFSEPQFRTTGHYGEMFAELFIALAACFAKMERIRISDRTKAGLERARAAGRKGGRPAKLFARDKALAMKASGKSFRQIAAALKVSLGTLQRAFKSAELERIENVARAKPKPRRKQRT